MGDGVCDSVGDSVWGSVGDSVCDSVGDLRNIIGGRYVYVTGNIM